MESGIQLDYVGLRHRRIFVGFAWWVLCVLDMLHRFTKLFLLHAISKGQALIGTLPGNKELGGRDRAGSGGGFLLIRLSLYRICAKGDCSHYALKHIVAQFNSFKEGIANYI